MGRTLKSIAKEALAKGLTLRAQYSEIEVDYVGTDLKTFMEAMEACDEMYALFLDAEGDPVDWLLYCGAHDPAERIIDHGTRGFVHHYLA